MQPSWTNADLEHTEIRHWQFINPVVIESFSGRFLDLLAASEFIIFIDNIV